MLLRAAKLAVVATIVIGGWLGLYAGFVRLASWLHDRYQPPEFINAWGAVVLAVVAFVALINAHMLAFRHVQTYGKFVRRLTNWN